MADEQQLAILKQGAEAWNKWWQAHPEIEHPDLRGAHLSGAALARVHLRWADLAEADLTGADLHGANLVLANLRGTNLRKANLSSAYLVAADLRGANLSKADLAMALLTGLYDSPADGTWREADLSGTNLSEARLDSTDLTNAKLVGADLRGAFLWKTNLTGVSFREADLRGADLREADLNRADLTGASLNGANTEDTLFTNLDLSQVEGLEAVHHSGPSTIGIDTLYKSGGNIPEAFLRGCGVPDDMITYIRHEIGSAKAIQFYSAFISYSSKDQEFAERLHTGLQAKHVRVWFAPEDLKIGDKFRVTIDEAIRVYDKLMVVLSENSINSAWVEKEVETAFDKEIRQKRIVLFPIRLDDTVMNSETAWAADIRRQRHIGDFTRWKDHDSYQNAFARLLRDLQADSKQANNK